MTSHELSNMIYDIKEKLTDKEFKDLMDKLSIKNEEEEECFYEFTYLEQEVSIEGQGAGDIENFDDIEKCYLITPKLKTKIIKKIEMKRGFPDLKNIMENPPLYSYLDIRFKEINSSYHMDESILVIDDPMNRVYNPTYFSSEYTNTDDKAVNGPWIQFTKIIPISLKKMST